MQEMRSMFFSPKLSQCRSAKLMLFEDNLKNMFTTIKGDSFALSQKKKSKALNDNSKLSANLSKNWDGFKNIEDSKKKTPKVVNATNAMRVNFSNKSLVQKMKKTWKATEDAPKLKKFHNSTVNLNFKKTLQKATQPTGHSETPKRKNSTKSRKKTLADLHRSNSREKSIQKYLEEKFGELHSKNSHRQNSTLTPCNSVDSKDPKSELFFPPKPLKSDSYSNYDIFHSSKLLYKNSHRERETKKSIPPKGLTSKTTKGKDGSPFGAKKIFNAEHRKSLRLNTSQEARLKNGTLRKVLKLFFYSQRSSIIRRHRLVMRGSGIRWGSIWIFWMGVPVGG